MLAAYVSSFDADDPLSGLTVGDWPGGARSAPDWVPLSLVAGTVNPHDLWALRGAVKLPLGLPSVLGTDAVGEAADGTRYIVHSVLGDPARGGGDQTLDPSRTTLSDAGFGTLAEQILVPAGNLVPLPDGLEPAEAACLPTAWLTAYRMLFSKAGLKAGDRLLVQGAGGGVSTAAISLGVAAGAEVHVVSRSAERRARSLELGAHAALAPGDRLAGGADVVVDAVGPATLRSSIAATRPGAAVVICGSSTGFRADLDVSKVFSRQLRILGSTMGTLEELRALVDFVMRTGIRPVIDSALPLHRAAEQFARLDAGEGFGKLVVTA